MIEVEDGSPPGAIKEPVMVAPNVISSSVLGLVAWWLGSHSNLVIVRDLVARNFKGNDIFAAWSKLREVIQLDRLYIHQSGTGPRSSWLKSW